MDHITELFKVYKQLIRNLKTPFVNIQRVESNGQTFFRLLGGGAQDVVLHSGLAFPMLLGLLQTTALFYNIPNFQADPNDLMGSTVALIDIAQKDLVRELSTISAEPDSQHPG